MPTPPTVRDPRETEIVVILKGGLTSGLTFSTQLDIPQPGGVGGGAPARAAWTCVT